MPSVFPPDTPVHFAAPFGLGPLGAVNVAPQNSPAEVGACVYNITVCQAGFRVDAPGFGVDDIAFGTVPLDVRSLAGQIQEQEPRAQIAWQEVDTGTPPQIVNTPGAPAQITVSAPGSAAVTLTVNVATPSAN